MQASHVTLDQFHAIFANAKESELTPVIVPGRHTKMREPKRVLLKKYFSIQKSVIVVVYISFYIIRLCVFLSRRKLDKCLGRCDKTRDR